MSKLIEQPSPAVCYELQTTDEDVEAINKLEINRMLMLLHLIREFETQLLVLKDADLVHGPVHVSIGQEAVAAAVAVALRKTDMVASTHRAHGHFLSKAFLYYAPNNYNPISDVITPAMQTAVNKTLAEIMGLKDGWCGGRGGSMHLYDGESGNLGSNAIVGGGIPIATGAAWAQPLQQRDNVVVSFFGDGAINQGCFHEVANMAALWNVPVLYLVENNLYAVGTCTEESSCVEDLALRTLGYGFDSLIVDGMNPVSMYVAVKNTVADMRENPFPFLIEAKTYRYYHHGGGIIGSAFGYRTKEEEADWLTKDPLQTFPEKLIDLNIISVAENEVYHELAVSTVAQAIDYCTEQVDGERIIPAAKWPDPETTVNDIRYEADVFTDVQFVEKEDFTSFKEMSYVQAISGTTLRAMERDERVIVMGEEVANLRGGAYSATRGIKENVPERLFNTPISETGFIGMAGGLASVGMQPVVEVMFPDFALMSSDQLFNQIGKLRHMYGGQVKFPIVLRTRIAMGFGYGGQHSMDPSAVFALFSGWRIVAPSNAFDYIGLFNTAMLFQDPVLIVEHGQIYADVDQVPADNVDYCVEYGKAKVVKTGTDLTVLTYLLSVKHCMQVAEELQAQDMSVEVIDLRTLDYTGMDYTTIGESIKKTGRVLIVEQAPRSMTLGPRITDEIQERFFDYMDAPVRKVAGLDVPPPVSKKLEEAALPSLERIKTGMIRAIKDL
jgi:2-oxoisovalerate dehydrogenase E1 component